jgi:hypothetical protein
LAYLVRRASGRVEIRESVATPRGPRSRTLATFRGALTPEVVDEAQRRASRPLERARLEARAAALKVPVTERREDRPARELLAALRSGAAVDPVLVTLLKQALDPLPGVPAPAPLAEVAEWVGADSSRRGAALRDLLRLSDRIARSRQPGRARPQVPFPRFRSRRGRAA